MRFAFIAKTSDILPVERLCQIMDVSPRGYRAYRDRPLTQNQRKDMVVLAHTREQFTLSLGSYGRPRMIEELKELDLEHGHCVTATAEELHPPHRPWQPLVFSRLSENLAPDRLQGPMIGTSNCYDNAARLWKECYTWACRAMVETFFKAIKAELLWQQSWKTCRDAEIAIFEYINGFYNPRCRHSALGWKSSLAFDAKAALASNRSGTKA